MKRSPSKGGRVWDGLGRFNRSGAVSHVDRHGIAVDLYPSEYSTPYLSKSKFSWKIYPFFHTTGKQDPCEHFFRNNPDFLSKIVCSFLHGAKLQPIYTGSGNEFRKTTDDFLTNTSTMRLISGTFFLWIGLCIGGANATDAWLVDTRGTTFQSEDGDIGHLTVNKLDRDSSDRFQWISSTQDDFLSTHDPDIPLVIIIHGNWMKFHEAKSHGIKFHGISRNRGEHRLLVWSWPSERALRNIRQDALLKARRADVQAKFLAAFLRKLRPGSKVSLIGFSFGSKLACETLQLLADTAEYPHSEEEGKIGHGLQLRTVLLAAAMDRQSLAPDKQYDRALSSTEKMLIHVNQDDKTLRWYPLLKGCGGPRAVGREGVSTFGLSAEYADRIRSRNVRKLIGRAHGFETSLRAFLACRDDFSHYALFD